MKQYIFHLLFDQSCFFSQAHTAFYTTKMGFALLTLFMGCRTSYFILPVLQIIFIIVGRGFTCNDASKENNRIIFNFMASSKQSYQHIENETTERMNGEAG